MTLLHDLEPLLPGDDETAARRDALVRELGAAAKVAEPRSFGRSGRRMLRRGSILAVAAALGVGAALFVPRPDGVDAVEPARAAVVLPRGGILHTRIRYEPGRSDELATVTRRSADGRPIGGVIGTLTGTVERWSAADPSRSREVQFVRAPDGRTQTIQTSTSPKRLTTFNSWDPRPTSESLHWRQARELEAVRKRLSMGVGGVTSLAQEDPVEAIRVLLRGGVLKDAGTQVLAGKEVVRLVGQTGGLSSGWSWSPPVRVEYLVDASTYEPRRVTSVQTLRARPDDPDPAAHRDRRIVDRWIFETFERLPRNAETEKLLEIDPTP